MFWPIRQRGLGKVTSHAGAEAGTNAVAAGPSGSRSAGQRPGACDRKGGAAVSKAIAMRTVSAQSRQ